jgi:hypothetical protein
MKNIIILMLFVLVGFSNVTAQEVNKKYMKTLKKMFELSGTEANYQVFITEYVDVVKRSFPDIDSDFWNEFEKDFLKVSIDDLTEMVAPIYVKYLTQDDLRALIKFYSSDIGLKLTEVTPAITLESMKIGEEWGKKMGEDIIERLEKENNK